MIEEKDILAYLDGNSSTELRKRVEAWVSESPANEEEFEFTKMMWEESSAVHDYVRFDTNSEWEAFEKMIDAPKLNVAKPSVDKTKVIPLKRRNSWRSGLSIAASAAVLVAATWLFWPQSEYIDIVNAPADTEIELEDGSIVSIKKGANFKTKRSYKYETQRNVDVSGEVNFDIASDPDKPFIVNTEESAVEVLGTIFNVVTEGVEATVANEEGLVKFFVIEDPSESVEIKEGESFKYDGTGFVNMKPEPVPPPARVIPKVGDILTHLRKVSNSRVTLGSGVNENSLRELDIDFDGKTVREIIGLMEEKAIVVYLDRGCADCIEIVEIIPKRR